MSRLCRFITDRDIQAIVFFFFLFCTRMYPAVDILLSAMYHCYLKEMDILRNVIG